LAEGDRTSKKTDMISFANAVAAIVSSSMQSRIDEINATIKARAFGRTSQANG
jgi:hypothetical protein